MIKTRSRDVLFAAFREIDYYTIVLLAGLFVIIGGITKAGVIDLLGDKLAGISGDGSASSIFIIYTVIVGCRCSVRHL